MPAYDYHCEECDALVEIRHSMRDDPVAECPACGSGSFARVLSPPTIIDATPKTIGSLADRNEGPGRRYWLDKVRHDHAEARAQTRDQVGVKEIPFWRDSPKINTQLNELTPKEKFNYIMTGDSAEPITPNISLETAS